MHFFLFYRVAKKGNDDEIGSDYIELKGFLSFLILHELSLKNLCGDELSTRIGQRKKGPLTPGTIYPALKRLRKKKLIIYRRQGRKKVYFLTATGKSELDRLYALFSNYFYGLKNKIFRKPIRKRPTSTKS
jgi:DNA-binding PadR family transcriptional regulator